LKFFEERGHKIIPSAALAPENDPTTLFTGSGMQPLIPYLLGQKHPLGTRLADSQKCFRAEDIDEVGDNRHTTFFEMLGNWSLGDYFKEEQLSWFFEFLTQKVGLSKEKLWVTCFEGDEKNNIPKDKEAAAIWEKLGIAKDHILFYGAKKNWWSRAGVPENMPAGEPGGPDSEVFFEFADVPHDTKFGEKCHPNCDCGRFMEIGNSVFMEYQKQEDGSFAKLAQRNVDFGGGLERIVAAKNGDSDIFKIDTLSVVIKKIEELSGAQYTPKMTEVRPPSSRPPSSLQAFRIIADHIRGAVFMIGDNVLPSNTDRGYFVRRLLRRAVRYADVLGMEQGKFAELALPVIESYSGHYPELAEYETLIKETIQKEENRFRETLANGLKEFEKLSSGNISGKKAFNLYQSYGFPLEVTLDLAREKGISVDEAGFKEELKKHQEISRAGAKKKFKGGLADTKEETVRLHTAHHLLLAALRQVLGEYVHQRGSNITAERLRIDFSHPQKMSPEELKQVEDLVNQKIAENLDMIRKEMPKEEAMQMGAEMEFGVKYGDVVSVYVAQDKQGNVFSKEFCGGPHVERTGQLGHFKITKEESVSSGLRRLRAILA